MEKCTVCVRVLLNEELKGGGGARRQCLSGFLTHEESPPLRDLGSGFSLIHL